MNDKVTVLVIETDPTLASALQRALDQIDGYKPIFVGFDVPVRHIEGYKPDVCIVGASHDLGQCVRSVQKLKIVDRSLPILVYSDDESLIGGSLKGPFDGVYTINIGASPAELELALATALRERQSLRSSFEVPVLIGISPEIRRIREKIQRIADKEITVLIVGESGTGKELIARAIHWHSSRRNGPLLKINCAALPDDLLESEVFGFQQGAFTGAHKSKPGRLELAHGGTLFIDEIGALSLSLQVKFLQVLEDKSFSRLGGIQDKTVDARVVAATNSDLWEMVRKGEFRKDLYYRLNVFRIEAPPLRRRREDISLLADYFLNKYCYELNREALPIPLEVLKALEAYDWPGNVRELENLVRRAIVLREWDFVFKDLDLNLDLDGVSGGTGELWDGIMGDGPEWRLEKVIEQKNFSLKSITKRYVSEVERRAIIKALQQTNWNRKKAAELLDVSYKTLLNRIAEMGLKPF